MKKRFFAAVLAATMVVSSAVTVLAQDVSNDAAFVNKSRSKSVDSDFDITYSTHVAAYKKGVNAWENVAFEFFAEDGKSCITIVCNGGAWSWPDATNPWGCEFKNECTDKDMTLLKDADMVIDVEKKGAALSLTGTVGNDVVWTAAVTGNEAFASAAGTVHLTGEETDLTNISYKNNINGSVDTDEVLSPGTDDVEAGIVEVLPEEVVEDSKENLVEQVEDVTAEDEMVVTEIAKKEGETVSIKLSSLEMGSATDVKVYFFNSVTGKYELVTVEVVDGVVKFESLGEGEYIFVEKKEKTTEEITTEEITTEEKTTEETTTAKTEETTTTKEATKTDGPDTGDSAPIAILAAIATLAGAGVVVSRKKRA